MLAWVMPSSGARAFQPVGPAGRLKASRGLAEKRLHRLQELADTVPKKDIEAAESELASLHGRIAAVGAGLSGREALVAPVSGVLAASNAGRPGGRAEELIFEVIDPDSHQHRGQRLRALALDQVVSASVAVGERSVP